MRLKMSGGGALPAERSFASPARRQQSALATSSFKSRALAALLSFLFIVGLGASIFLTYSPATAPQAHAAAPTAPAAGIVATMVVPANAQAADLLSANKSMVTGCQWRSENDSAWKTGAMATTDIVAGKTYYVFVPTATNNSAAKLPNIKADVTLDFNDSTLTAAPNGFMNYFIYGCTKITSITLFDTAQLTSTGTNFFYNFASGATGLQSLTAPNTSNIASVGAYFMASYAAGCTGLNNNGANTGLGVPDVSKITTLGTTAVNYFMASYAAGCTGLNTLSAPTLSALNTTVAYQYILSKYAQGCTGLTSLGAPTFCSSFTQVGTQLLEYYAQGCTSLLALSAPTFASTFTTAGNLFLTYYASGCTSLVSLGVPNTGSLTTVGTNFMSYYANGCTSLPTLTAPDVANINLTATQTNFLSNYAAGCTLLTSLTAPTLKVGVTALGASFMDSYANGCTILPSLAAPVLPSTLTNVGQSFLRNYAKGCTLLTSLGVPDTSHLTSVDGSGGEFLASYAQDCISLTTLGVPDTSSITATSISFMAAYAKGCTSLTSLRAPDLSSMAQTFANFLVEYAAGCTSLTQLDMPTNMLLTNATSDARRVPGNNFMQAYAKGCTSLTSLGAPDLSHFAALGNPPSNFMFEFAAGCTALTTLAVPDTTFLLMLSIAAVPTAGTNFMGNYAADCTALNELHFAGAPAYLDRYNVSFDVPQAAATDTNGLKAVVDPAQLLAWRTLTLTGKTLDLNYISDTSVVASDGSGSNIEYAVNIIYTAAPSPANGIVTASYDSARAGYGVQLDIAPAAGYRLVAPLASGLQVTNLANGNTLPLTLLSPTSAYFAMPAGAANVYVSFEPIAGAQPVPPDSGVTATLVVDASATPLTKAMVNSSQWSSDGTLWFSTPLVVQPGTTYYLFTPLNPTGGWAPSQTPVLPNVRAAVTSLDLDSAITTVPANFMRGYAYGCNLLSALTAPDTSHLTSVGDFFLYSFAYGCTGLSQLDAPNTSQIYMAGSNFMYGYAQNCTGLAQLGAPNTSALFIFTDSGNGLNFLMYYAYGCTRLTALAAPVLSANLTSVGASFLQGYAQGGTMLTALAVPDTSHLTAVGNNFMSNYAQNCTLLWQLSAPDTSALTTVGTNFLTAYASGASMLTYLGVPDTSAFTGTPAVATFMTSFAANCIKLQRLVMSSAPGYFGTMANVTAAQSWNVPAAAGSNGLKAVVPSGTETAWQALADGSGAVTTAQKILYVNQIQSAANVVVNDGSTSAAYAVNIAYTTNPANGVVSTDLTAANTAQAGQTVLLTVAADPGYRLAQNGLSASYNVADQLTLITLSPGVYYFIMPAAAVSVSATFEAAGAPVPPAGALGVIGTIAVAPDAALLTAAKTMVKNSQWSTDGVNWLNIAMPATTMQPGGTYYIFTPFSDSSNNMPATGTTAVLPNIKAAVTVELPASVTSVGNYFLAGYAYGSTNITSLDVPDTSRLTSAGTYFMSYYARGCTALTALSMPVLSNSLTSAGNYFFYGYAYGATKLTSLNVPDTSKITSVGTYFLAQYAYGCSALTNLDVPALATTLTSVGDNFLNEYARGVSILTTLSVPDTSHLTSTGTYFMATYAYNAAKLTRLDVPDTSGLTAAANFFLYEYAYGCAALPSLSVPDTSHIAQAGSNFMNSYAYGCSALTTLDAPDTSNLTTVGTYFLTSYANGGAAGTSKLVSLGVPNTTKLTSVGTNFMTSYAVNGGALINLLMTSGPGWFYDHDVSWGVPASRLGIVQAVVPATGSNIADWQALTATGKTLALNYITSNSKVVDPSQIIVPDTSAPTGTITLGSNNFSVFFPVSLFNLFKAGPQTAFVSALDDSGLAVVVEYYLSSSTTGMAAAKTELDLYNLQASNWTSYPTGGITLAAGSTHIIYVRLIDAANNYTYLSSSGVVVAYTASTGSPTSLSFDKAAPASQVLTLALSGNTVDRVVSGSYNLAATTDYTLNAAGDEITLLSAYLDTLAVGSYTLDVYYNPLGISWPLSSQLLPGSDTQSKLSITLAVSNSSSTPGGVKPEIELPAVTALQVGAVASTTLTLLDSANNPIGSFASIFVGSDAPAIATAVYDKATSTLSISALSIGDAVIKLQSAAAAADYIIKVKVIAVPTIVPTHDDDGGNSGVSASGTVKGVPQGTSAVKLTSCKITSGAGHDALLAEATSKNYTHLASFNITLTYDGVEQHDSFGNLTLSLPVPSGYEGSSVYVLHLHADGRISNQVVTVAGNKATITVSDLSSFAVITPKVATSTNPPSSSGSLSSSGTSNSAGSLSSSYSPSSSSGGSLRSTLTGTDGLESADGELSSSDNWNISNNGDSSNTSASTELSGTSDDGFNWGIFWLIILAFAVGGGVFWFIYRRRKIEAILREGE